MHAINLRPTDRTLRQFAAGGVVVLGLFAAPWMWYRGATTAAQALGLVAIGLLVLAVAYPRLLKWPFVAASIITWPLGLIVSYAALAVVFYLVITPIGLVFRLLGRDALKRDFDRQAESYWEPREPQADSESYLRQF